MVEKQAFIKSLRNKIRENGEKLHKMSCITSVSLEIPYFRGFS